MATKRDPEWQLQQAIKALAGCHQASSQEGGGPFLAFLAALGSAKLFVGCDPSEHSSNKAHALYEWPVHPIREQKGMHAKALLEMEGLLKKWT